VSGFTSGTTSPEMLTQIVMSFSYSSPALRVFTEAISGFSASTFRETRDRAYYLDPGMSQLLHGLFVKSFRSIHELLMPAISIMTSEQVDLIRQSFDAIWSVRRKLAVTFYGRFFELAPDALQLFPSDMERQHLKLMDSIAAIVGALDKRELFQSVISHTARHHVGFGVKPSHFAAFGEALIWGLEQQFGAAFTPELKKAWITLYDAVQGEMIKRRPLL
jgi:hemoglobin-like flavoprotein